MSDPNANEGVEALAALVGTTQAELQKVDDAIVGESASLSKDTFGGQQILQGHINNVRKDIPGAHNTPAAAPPPPPSDFEYPPPPQQQVYTQPAQPVQHVQHVQPAPSYGGEITIILQKLVDIDNRIGELTSRLNDIEYFDKKVVDSLTRGLKSKVKQVTIKLDDTNHS